MNLIKFLLLLFLIGLTGITSAQKLQFSESGEFKIIQFTDLHIDYEHGYNDPVFDLVAEIIDSEHPNLVMFTGDVVVKEKPEEIYLRFEEIFAARKMAWAVVLGNHDEEYETSGDQIVEILDKLPNCLTYKEKGIKGASNFVLPVVGKDRKTKAVIYGLDSNSSSKIEKRVGGYDWFGFDQIGWYRKTSGSFASKNGGQPVPSLAFFHIPFTEYNEAWDANGANPVGVKNERVSCADVNPGMFAAMVECNDVMGTFVGHDHTNDYIGVSHNIALAFGRCSGGVNSYGDLPDGGRVIVLKEGKRTFDTWIHEKGGNIVYKCTFPDSFTTLQKK